MNVRPSILCPIDYSDASAAALRYAAAIADHFVTRLIVLTVEDPLLTAARGVAAGRPWTADDAEADAVVFVGRALADAPALIAMCEYEVAFGKPAVEILRVARERSCDLTVMSTHGVTGARKRVFGSTTERVLRETSVPVLVTPAHAAGAICVEDAARLVGRIVAPVDLSPASIHQARVAGGLADALKVPLLLLHAVPAPNHEGQEAAQEALTSLRAEVSPRVVTETLVVTGDTVDETLAAVRERHAGLVVMGLHGSRMLGPRMGSVTYRLLCAAPTLVLALPPKIVPASDRRLRESA